MTTNIEIVEIIEAVLDGEPGLRADKPIDERLRLIDEAIARLEAEGR